MSSTKIWILQVIENFPAAHAYRASQCNICWSGRFHTEKQCLFWCCWFVSLGFLCKKMSLHLDGQVRIAVEMLKLKFEAQQWSWGEHKHVSVQLFLLHKMADTLVVKICCAAFIPLDSAQKSWQESSNMTQPNSFSNACQNLQVLKQTRQVVGDLTNVRKELILDFSVLWEIFLTCMFSTLHHCVDFCGFQVKI